MSQSLSIPILNSALDAETSIVPIQGELPCKFEVPTRKLLDLLLALSPQSQKATDAQRQQIRQSLSKRFYNRTRPGFYLRASSNLHIAYLGQPGGHGKQHHWRIFCDEMLQPHIAKLIQGSALTVIPSTSSTNSHSVDSGNGNHTIEWGGLFLRSEAELRIAQALDQTGILFFANNVMSTIFSA